RLTSTAIDSANRRVSTGAHIAQRSVSQQFAEVTMAETKSTREQSQGGGPTLARRDAGTLQRRESGWFGGPVEFVDRMAEEMDRTFDRLFHDVGFPRRSLLARTPFRSVEQSGLWAPRIEAFQKGDKFIVRAELPGLKKEDVQVELNDDAITVQGERREEHEEEAEGRYHSERQYGRFYRRIPLPEGVIGESAQANFKDGVLEISMQAPPAEATRGRRLEIKEGSETRENK